MSSPSTRPALLLPLAVLVSACGTPQTPGTNIVAMTQDLGIGGDLQAVLAAAPADQPALADALWAQKDTASFAVRAAAIADGVKTRNPDVLAVQSAMQWRRTAPASGAPVLAADYLDLLVAALASRGLSYAPIATATTADLTFTGATGTVYRVTDREAILVRAGVVASGVASGTFVAYRTVSIAGAAVPYLRGWASAQVETGGKSFRFVATHLDGVDPATQGAQATELVRIAGARPVMIAGGIGADVGNPAWSGYAIVSSRETALSDAASMAGAGFPTCCRDAACVDPSAVLDRREDVILVSQEFMSWTGAREGTSMVNRLWPSPHAGVVAGVSLQ